MLTISDSRTEETDTSGNAITEMLESAGHEVVGRRIVRDDPPSVRGAVKGQVTNAEVIITSGGTGITTRDGTYEAISALLDKQLDGFGEIFRMLSYHEIGPAAMMSRACAGTIGKVVVISLPGSEKAVRLAMTKLVIPELTHLVQQATK